MTSGSIRPESTRPLPTRRRPTFGVTTLSAVTLSALTLSGVLAPVASAQGNDVIPQFRRFSSCSALLGDLRARAMPLVGPFGLDGGFVGIPRPTTRTTAATPGAPVTAPASAARETAPAVDEAPAEEIAASGGSSTTNTQEINVDEGDLVENDGRYVYSVVDGSLKIVDTVDSRRVASLSLPPGSHQLLLSGSRLAVASQVAGAASEAALSVYDVANPAAPRLLATTHLEGQLIAARATEGRVRLVLSTPFGQRLKFPGRNRPISSADDAAAATAENRAYLRRAPISAWLPRIYDTKANGTFTPVRVALGCSDIGRPADASGLGFTWVASVDLRPGSNPAGRGSAAVIADARAVYASSTTLFVATQPQRFGTPIPFVRCSPNFPCAPPQLPQVEGLRTEIHAFDLRRPDGADYLASGSVPGSLLNQFALSEHQGILRVATTRNDAGFGSTTESEVRTLRRDGKALRTLGVVGGLGRNERIYAVRFLGDLGYVVTFRQIDPLYVVDLRNPAAPRVAGELKIPGYSAYLHPVAPGRLLGIGRDGDASGRVLGTQLSLFDVSDPANPIRTAQLRIGDQSEAEYDHLAFLWWAKTGQVVVPIQGFVQATAAVPYSLPSMAAVVVKVTGLGADPAALTEQGRVRHPGREIDGFVQGPAFPTTIPGSPQSAPSPVAAPRPRIEPVIRRSMIVSDRLVTVSPDGVKVSALDDLRDLAWIPTI